MTKTIHRETDISWVRNTTYSFNLDFTPGNFYLTIIDGTTALESWTISDATFASGDFVFFMEGSQKSLMSTSKNTRSLAQ